MLQYKHYVFLIYGVLCEWHFLRCQTQLVEDQLQSPTEKIPADCRSERNKKQRPLACVRLGSEGGQQRDRGKDVCECVQGSQGGGLGSLESRGVRFEP